MSRRTELIAKARAASAAGDTKKVARIRRRLSHRLRGEVRVITSIEGLRGEALRRRVEDGTYWYPQFAPRLNMKKIRRLSRQGAA